VTRLSVDYDVRDEEKDPMVHMEADTFIEYAAGDPPSLFRLDDLTGTERRSLQDDLTLAARVQQTLLPRRDFSSTSWQAHYHYAPAGLFGGDYCDFFETNSGLLFLLGDVSGKGLAASMLMSQLYATFRSLASADPPVDVMVEAANRIFSQSTPTGQFATLVVGRASRDGSIEFVSAGHPPLLHVRNSGVRYEPATGIPLGVFADERFQVRRLSLALGDTLLIYTDGLTEARRNQTSQEYGLRRLRNVAAQHPTAAPSRLISECLSDQRNFTEGAKQVDDLTLLVIRRTA
jgi:phosphoserine phosphatase RsbU/P